MATTTTFGEEGVSKEVQDFGFYLEEGFTLSKVWTVRNCPIDEDLHSWEGGDNLL